MQARLKLLVLIVGKYAGLFRLAQLLTRTGLRILCYHGISLGDEHVFRPKLFMSPRTFEQRLLFLKRHNYSVLPLGEAVKQLQQGSLPPRGVVITIDDGFYGSYRVARPLLERLSMPVTVYVTTYYVLEQTPVFGIAVAYMFWKTRKSVLDLTGLGLPLSGTVSLQDPAAQGTMTQIIEYGECQCDERRRSALARALGERLAVSYDTIAQLRMLSLMRIEELRELAMAGMDIQLHTHRHRFPDDEAVALQEIADNRAVLSSASQAQLEHFCYPSGEWSLRHWPWLVAAGVKTATTCEPGLNFPGAPPLRLRRFLDGDNVSAIEFEAELCGYTEIFRIARRAIRNVLKGRHDEMPLPRK